VSRNSILCQYKLHGVEIGSEIPRSSVKFFLQSVARRAGGIRAEQDAGIVLKEVKDARFVLFGRGAGLQESRLRENEAQESA
jgi:hypothetical protein